ncbi:MAG: 50S ribosomal protein L2 [Candidatus Nanoarchaeia archaeon]
MAKRLITQARGAGGPRYLAPSHRYFGAIKLAKPSAKLLRGEVMDIVNSVGHSAPLMIIKYENDEVGLLPAALGIRKGDTVFSGPGAPMQPGCVQKLGDIPTGYPVYNIEHVPFDGGRLIRTSGAAAQIVGKEGGQVFVKMPSKKVVAFNPDCRAIVGIVAGGGRVEKPWVKGGKHNIARRARNKLHPRVSGVAKNAIDHPFGGTHRRSLGIPMATRKGTPPGRKIGLLWPKKTGRGGKK